MAPGLSDLEGEASGRPIGGGESLDRLLADPKPSPADVRTLAAMLAVVAHDGEARPDLPARLGRVQHFLERFEGMIPLSRGLACLGGRGQAFSGRRARPGRARDRAWSGCTIRDSAPTSTSPASLRFRDGAGARGPAWSATACWSCAPPRRTGFKGAGWSSRATVGVSNLIFAFGLARLGDVAEANRLLEEGFAELQANDPVYKWIGRAYEFRIRQALEGKVPAALR